MSSQSPATAGRWDTGAAPIYGQMMAAPVVLLNLAFLRYLVGGLTSGGIK